MSIDVCGASSCVRAAVGLTLSDGGWSGARGERAATLSVGHALALPRPLVGDAQNAGQRVLVIETEHAAVELVGT